MQYLQTDDARRAEFWQLEALASLRRNLGAPIKQATYERLRAALADEFAAQSQEAQTDRVLG